jgi:uncharacterized surface protein with fasciclin (FAS1) repeats
MSKQPIRRLLLIGALTVSTTAATALTPAFAGASSKTTASATHSTKQSKTIVGVAASNPDFSTLVTAVKAAGLVKALNGKGPFTVFAPTNEAFAKIPADQLNALLADKAKLAAVLKYHVLKGKVPASALQPTQTVPTLEGGTIQIDLSDGKATITDGQGNLSNIVKTDIKAKNGVIHVIDTVLLPPSS